jgi:DNA-binding beta-propeller fold protein YncE
MRQRKNDLFLTSVLLFLIGCSIPVTVAAGAEVEANVLSTLNLDENPIDVATTADGKFVYILKSGEVQVYALNSGVLSGRIPVDKAISRISASAHGDKLFLLNEKTKTLSIVSVAFFQMFRVEGSPFKGSADAPVIVTVFSDYQ